MYVTKRNFWHYWQSTITLIILWAMTANAQISYIGSFESNLPSYFKKGNEPAGATLTWATDQAKSLGRSLKITKNATSDAAYWESDNMVDYWSQRHYKNVDMLIGAWVKTQNVNINPANDDARWYITYTFYDSAGALIGETKLPVNQTTATSAGWLADTNAVGQTILPKDAWKTIIKFVGGKNATGTVWADDFILVGRAGGWAGQDWNTAVDFPTGWLYWLPPNGGNDGLINSGFENTRITNEAAHTGLYSLKFDMPFTRQTHDGFVGTKRVLLNTSATDNSGSPAFELTGVKTGDVLRATVWIKASNLVPDSAAKYPDAWSVGLTYGFFKGNGNNDGFNNVDGYPKDMSFVFPPVTSFDWTPYTFDFTVPNTVDAKALEIRLHIYARFTGTVYFDDLTVEKLEVPDMNMVGGFESTLPSYFKKGNEPAGATLTWATDQAKSLGRSLKITKNATSDAAYWESDNMVDYWSQRHYKNVDMLIGAWVKTQNVNTNPANDDAKWYITYTFYDSAGALIGETKLPVNQTAATSAGWLADTNAVGQTILPKDAWKTIIKFVGGKNATGTVWADDFILVGRAGGWAGQDWNTAVDFPTGWLYWLPPNGGNDGIINSGFENTRITKEAAHSGLYSLKFDMPFTRQTHDGFVGTKRYMLNPTTPTDNSGGQLFQINGVKTGDVLRATVWIKASNLVPDSAAKYPDAWSVGLTYGFFKGNGNNDGFNNVDGYPKDMSFVFPPVTSFDWTPYTFDFTVPNTADAKALEIRLHVYARFTGTVYFDDLTVEKLDVPDMNMVGGFESTLPSYFKKGNEPAGATLTWASDQAKSLGRSLKITKNATSDAAYWESDNMVDYWSQRHYKNVDMLIGAWVKTQNVNTTPANDDAKWYITYTFYDSAGALIGETKLPVNQTTATSAGWLADTNAVGQTILPKDAWKTIIKFVGGKNATGTVWADDFILVGRAGGWAGQDWNTAVDFPTGWLYWLPPNGGNDGIINSGFENTRVTSEAAHSGQYSLKFDMPLTRQTHDGFVGTKRYLLNAAAPSDNVGGQLFQLNEIKTGDILRATVWIKASNLVPDSAAKYPDAWSVGLTYGFFKGNGNNDGFNNVDGYPKDMSFAFPAVTSFDWTPYTFDFAVPNTVDAKALEIRLHVYARFAGKVYFDDLKIEKISGATVDIKYDKFIPKEFTVFQNYPNPFNPTTQISYSIPQSSLVTVKVYDMLGKEIATLVNSNQDAGMHNITWNGMNNSGSQVSSGTYIYSVRYSGKQINKKMLFVK